MFELTSRSALTILIVGAIGAFAPAIPSRAALPVTFAHPEKIRYDHQAFTINGQDLYLFSGSFHYFRCAPELWEDRLMKIKAAGFNAVETYVAWNWHEPLPPGVGHGADMAQLDRFLTLAEKHGLWIIVRPGPYICAEWDEGGWPHWLARVHPGFRTDSKDDEKWSKYWYDEVLPVVRRHQITHGGKVILVQLENEYDFSGLPQAVMANYVKSLYADAKENGIDVPLITCWTSVARDKNDPVMSQLLDAVNFYPGWNIDSTLGAIEASKAQQPYSPPMVTELQGGWFSDVGGGSVRNTAEFGPDQVNALTKYVMAHGVTGSSYYMLYGGTNFGYWGSTGRTTSYDYTAPISEPGGLWDKYRAVKLIGDFVRIAGPAFVRTHPAPGGARIDTTGVEALVRTSADAGFLFLRNTKAQPVTATVALPAIGNGSHVVKAVLGPRDARILPLNFTAAGATIDRSNVELAEAVRLGSTPFFLSYGDPGDKAEITVNGKDASATVSDADQLQQVGEAVVAVTNRARAGRTRSFESSAGPVVIVSDSYLVHASSVTPSENPPGLGIEVQALPGPDNFSLLTANPVAVRVDGKPVRTVSEKTGGIYASRFSINVPAIPFGPVPIERARVRPDTSVPDIAGSPVPLNGTGSYHSLDQIGIFDSGYSLYRGTLTIAEKGTPEIRFYDRDWHAVYLDGKLVAGGGGSTVSLDPVTLGLVPGTKHAIRILYENEARPNGGNMEQVKGLASIRFSSDEGALGGWKLSPKPAGPLVANPPEASTGFDDSGWNSVDVGHGNQPFFTPQTNGWFRTHLLLTADELKKPNIQLEFGGVDDAATVFVNGRQAAHHDGWDEPFSVPIAADVREGDNIIAVYVENREGPGGIYKPVRFVSGALAAAEAPVSVSFGLNGQRQAWQNAAAADGGWPTLKIGDPAPDQAGVNWYRSTFRLPDTSGWQAPWGLDIQATGVAQIWINGHLAGRYFPQGPQRRFYLPACWLNSGVNSLVLTLRPAGKGDSAPALAIQSLTVSPYTEYTARVFNMELTPGK